MVGQIDDQADCKHSTGRFPDIIVSKAKVTLASLLNHDDAV